MKGAVTASTMTTENKTMDNVVTSQCAVSREGSYDHTLDVGDYIVHGKRFDNSHTSYPYSSQFWDGKVGVEGTLVGTTAGHGQFNDVDHTKTVWENPLRPIYHKHEGFYKGYPVEIVTTGLSAVESYKLEWGLTAGKNTLGSGTNDRDIALAKLEIGSQAAGTNLPTFLGELRDFRDVATRVSKAFRPAPNKLADLKKAFRRSAKKQSAGEFIRSMISLDLMNKFAVQPLLRDIENLRQYGRHISSQVDRLRSSEPVAVHSAHTTRKSRTYNYNSGANSWYHKGHMVVDSERLTTVSAYVVFDYAEIKNSNKLLHLDALGFNRPLETVWELIPYSFVVDYFVGIGEFLSQFRGQFLSAPYEVIDEGYSQKSTIRAAQTRVFDTGWYTSNWCNTGGNSSVTGIATRTTYTRRAGLPIWSVAAPQFRLPSVNQLGTIGELLYLSNS